MKRLLGAGVFVCMLLVFRAAFAGGTESDVKEALQSLQDYIGGWKGNGFFERDRNLWKETANWSWRFKGKDMWLSVEFPFGKFYKAGEMRFLPAKERYQLTLVDKKDKKSAFEGRLKKGRLVLERVDPETKETQQIAMNMAGGGIRLIYTYSVKGENRTLFNKQWQVAMTKEGETFGTAEKKIECVVTGGLGTIPVSHKGITYYVCCGGCRDAFNENPEKILKEYFAKKKGN